MNSTDPASSAGQSQPNPASNAGQNGQPSSKKRYSLYSKEFRQKCIDIGVYPESHKIDDQRTPDPQNLEQIHGILSRRRESLSNSKDLKEAFKIFKRHNAEATSEAKTMTKVVPLIAGSSDDNYVSGTGLPFNHIEEFSPYLPQPRPDIFYGAPPQQINEKVREALSNFIVPSTDKTLPVAPNFFLEGKSKSAPGDVGERQAMYNGAVGARAMHKIQTYGNSTPTYDGNTYTLSSMYYPQFAALTIYATHLGPPPCIGGNPQYYTTEVGTFYLKFSEESFREGLQAFRNARQWTLEQRNIFIARANAVVTSTAQSSNSANAHANEVVTSTAPS